MNLAQYVQKIPVKYRLIIAHCIPMVLVLFTTGIVASILAEKSLFKSLDATLLVSAKAILEEGERNADSLRSFRSSPYWWSIIIDDSDFRRQLSIRSYRKMVNMGNRTNEKESNLSNQFPLTPYSMVRAQKGLATYETFPSSSSGVADLRLVTVPAIRNGHFTGELVQVGTLLDSTQKVIMQINLAIFAGLTVVTVVFILFGFLLTRAALTPVLKITNAARDLSANNLNKRLSVATAADELQTLEITFNSMLDRLEDTISRLRRFSSDVSHELRTPLSVISGEAELALRKDRGPTEYKDTLSRIFTEAKGMTGIVEDLLLLARAQGESLDLRRETIDLNSFCQNIRNDLLKSFQAKNVNINILVKTEGAISVSINYLSLVLKNLLQNALKHSRVGSRVDFEAGIVGKNIVFMVRDEGGGISESDLPHIFDSFFRADNARNRELGGAGIGLSLALALVKLHGGEIKVSSKIGLGSEFSVVIPNQKILEAINMKPPI